MNNTKFINLTAEKNVMFSFMSFVMDPLYLRIFLVTCLVFIITFIFWWSYMKLSMKDLFELKRPEGRKAGFWNMLVYWMKYIFIFPLLIFFWFMLFVICLRMLSYKTEVTDIMFLGIVLISAVRASAYINQRMAEDLGKMLPIALLTAVVLSPSFMTINISINDIYLFRDNLIGFAKYLLFIIAFELFLKMIDGIICKVKSKRGNGKEPKKRKADAPDGVDP